MTLQFISPTVNKPVRSKMATVAIGKLEIFDNTFERMKNMQQTKKGTNLKVLRKKKPIAKTFEELIELWT